MSKLLGSAIIASASLLFASAALAQSTPATGDRNPTAASLIQQLTPTGQSLTLSEPRGFHRLPPSPNASASGTKDQPAASETRSTSTGAEAPTASVYVEFATGSAELTPPAMAELDELGKALSSNALSGYRFRIEGHTDTVGTKDYNQSLSERRAEAVATYLKQKFNIDDKRLIPVGLGSDHLLVPTADQTPEARNRRVQVVNLGA